MRQKNDSFRKISFAYSVFAILFAIAAILYAAAYILVDPKILSYDSLYYMINDFNISVSSSSDDNGYLYYDNGENISFGEYRGGLAVINDETLIAFSSRGKRTLYVKHGMSNPEMRTSDDYIAAFSQNGSGVNIYNSFSLVYTENNLEGLKDLSSYSVIDVALASDGAFAVAVNVGVLDSRVYLYGESGKLRAEYRYNHLLTSVSLNESATKIGITFIQSASESGALVSGTLVYDTTKSEPLATDIRKGSYPVSASFAGDNLYSVYSDGVSIYNADLMLFTSRNTDNDEVISYAKTNAYGCLGVSKSSKTGEKKRVFVFDKMCNMVYNVETQSNDPILGDYSLCGGMLLCREGKNIKAIMLDNGKTASFELESDDIESSTVILETVDDRVRAVACYATKGKIINLEFEGE